MCDAQCVRVYGPCLCKQLIDEVAMADLAKGCTTGSTGRSSPLEGMTILLGIVFIRKRFANSVS